MHRPHDGLRHGISPRRSKEEFAMSHPRFAARGLARALGDTEKNVAEFAKQ